jgi:hypothetical protein
MKLLTDSGRTRVSGSLSPVTALPALANINVWHICSEGLHFGSTPNASVTTEYSEFIFQRSESSCSGRFLCMSKQPK